MHSDRRVKIESKIISGLTIIREAFTETVKAEVGMNKDMTMSKLIAQSRTRYFREPALCQGLEHPIKLVDGILIDAEDMPNVNLERSDRCEIWCRTCQSGQARYITQKEMMRGRHTTCVSHHPSAPKTSQSYPTAGSCKRGRKCGSTCCTGRYRENVGSVGTNEQWQEKNRASPNAPLGPVLIGLILDLPYLHFHAVLGESNILALHLFARIFAYILHDAVDNESDRGNDADKDEEEDEGNEIAGAHGGVCLSGYRRV